MWPGLIPHTKSNEPQRGKVPRTIYVCILAHTGSSQFVIWQAFAMKLIPFIISVALALLVGCDGGNGQPKGSPEPGLQTANNDSSGTDLAEARREFTTKLTSSGPAPQDFEDAVPFTGIKEVNYTSGELKLKGWLSDDPGDGKKRPAVVYLHGGWSFAANDWLDAAPFVDAGFVVMMPMLRGENGNPGIYEGFYGEVDDAIAAGRFVSELPYVDAGNVFVAGHSVGAVLTVLTAMLPSNYKAAAALSGYLDMETWSAIEHPSRVIYDVTNPEEIRLRNPMAFSASLRIPLILYAERGGIDAINTAFLARAKRVGKSCELVVSEGDHLSMVVPSVQHAIKWYHNHMNK